MIAATFSLAPATLGGNRRPPRRSAAACRRRPRRWACGLLLGAVLSAADARAQGTAPDSARGRADSLALDSLRARLARAEGAIAILREELAGETESTVHTRSRFRVDFSARVLMNTFFTSGRVNNEDVPLLVLEPPAPGSASPANASLGFTMRQTRFGLATSVQDVLGGVFDADADVDLYGGVQNGPGDRRLFPEPRLRTARARMTWAGTEVMVGAETPLISDLDPVSLAAVGVPDFSGAGNLWNWLPQLRVTRLLGRDTSAAAGMRWAIQGAVMTPYAAQTAPGEPDAVDAGDRSRRPALEARLRARWGEDADATISDALIARGGGEIGIGMHRGWITIAPGVTKESHAVSLDAHAVLLPGIEVRGEAYAGRLLRGLGGGGIAQNFGVDAGEYPPGSPPPPAGALGPPVRDAAGWAQLNVQPHPLVLGSIGCGVDVANADDHPTRLQNTVCAISASWRPAQPLVLGIEYRRLGTRYDSGTYGAQHVNLALGFEL